ncbi:hypothetical protein M5K25_006671 [Dendrobium thyrsiflorum]|uniref:Uncharacterized protein n=1 Tax=Dendrobium thyrsiflorum TaxID=117978 RepID=A0ABD0VDF6_DENTH
MERSRPAMEGVEMHAKGRKFPSQPASSGPSDQKCRNFRSDRNGRSSDERSRAEKEESKKRSTGERCAIWSLSSTFFESISSERLSWQASLRSDISYLSAALRRAKRCFLPLNDPARSCIRLVSELYHSRMTDKGKQPAIDEARSLEALWTSQANLIRQVESLSTDVQRLSIEVRREFNLNRTRNAPHQRRREPTPVMAAGGRRGESLIPAVDDDAAAAIAAATSFMQSKSPSSSPAFPSLAAASIPLSSSSTQKRRQEEIISTLKSPKFLKERFGFNDSH